MCLVRNFFRDPDGAIKIEAMNNTVVSWWKNRHQKNLPVRVTPTVSDDEREKCLEEVKKLFKLAVDVCRRNCIRRLLDYATSTEDVRRPDGQFASTWAQLVIAMKEYNKTGNIFLWLIVVCMFLFFYSQFFKVITMLRVAFCIMLFIPVGNLMMRTWCCWRLGWRTVHGRTRKQHNQKGGWRRLTARCWTRSGSKSVGWGVDNPRRWLLMVTKSAENSSTGLSLSKNTTWFKTQKKKGKPNCFVFFFVFFFNWPFICLIFF